MVDLLENDSIHQWDDDFEKIHDEIEQHEKFLEENEIEEDKYIIRGVKRKEFNK